MSSLRTDGNYTQWRITGSTVLPHTYAQLGAQTSISVGLCIERQEALFTVLAPPAPTWQLFRLLIQRQISN